MSFGREALHVADRAHDLRGHSIGPMPKISVRVVPQAFTAAEILSFRSAIFRSSVRMSLRISEANLRRRGAEAPWGRMPRTMRAAR